MIRQIPILDEPGTLWLHDDMIVECVTINGIPRIHVIHAGMYRPDLDRWAASRSGVRQELEQRGIGGLSELTEVREKTMRTVAWQDMQRYIAGEVE